MGKKLLSLLLTFMMVITILPIMNKTVFADNITATAFNVPDSWEENEDTLTTIDLQGFQACTEEVASTWTGAPASGRALLIYDISTTQINAVVFENGNPKASMNILNQKKLVCMTKNIYDIYYITGITPVNVTGVTLDPTSTSLNVGGTKTLTATVEPSNASDKTVKWSVDNSNVKLYSDESCETEVGAEATSTLTVYAKGITAGNSTVTVTSNADSTKDAECAVTVNEAATGVKYIDENGDEQTCDEYTVVTSDMTTMGNSWYVVKGNVTISTRIITNGTVNLILCDGVTLTAEKGVAVTGTNSLTIYGQTSGTGTLTATGTQQAAGIGGYYEDKEPWEPYPCGTITINGGTVNATGAYSGAGIGGYSSAEGGTITINSGTVTANGGEEASGIGDGGSRNSGSSVSVTINGGTVNATGGKGAAGIGGGNSSADCNVTINGGTVTATANGNYSYGAGIGTAGWSADGGSITITGGTVTASGLVSGDSGIGGNNCSINITGGTINANVNNENASYGLKGGNVTISNATVTANGKTNGIGCTNLTITSGNVTVIGDYGAISSPVINKIDGTGWTNTAGTTDKAYIPVSESGQTIPNTIKKVQFPAVTYNVTITPGDNMTKTETSGAASQTVPGAITDVVYTADTNYYFPEGYSVTPINGISVTRNSYNQITVSGTPTANTTITLADTMLKPIPLAPTTAAAVDCTSVANNDGKLTGVTADMEYKKSDAESWTAGTGSDITDLGPGTYYVRYKETETSQASQNQELTIRKYVSYTVTFNVENGSWDDETAAEKEVTLTGHEGDELKLTAAQIPAVGNKPADTYKVGSWDVTPSTETVITENTTYTYTYALKDPATVTEVPTAKENLIYTGEDQALVNAGTATGGTMKYALGTDTTTVPTDWSDSISKGNKTGTYYVWYKAVGDTDHRDSDAGTVTATIEAVDREALDTAITDATECYNSIKDNTDYSTIASTLNEAITKAKAVRDDQDKTEAEIGTAVTELNNAIDTAKAGVVSTMIENLPAPADITTANKDAIEAAREAYDNLKTDAQRGKVTNLDKLVAAEKTLDKALFNEYKETKKTVAGNMAQDGDSAAATKLISDAIEAINALAYDNNKTLEENKAAVDAIINKLATDLENQRAADAVNSTIAALPADITLENEDAVKAAREAYENLSDDQKALVNPDMLTKLKAAETAIADLKAAKAVDEKIAALPAAEDVTLDNKSDIEAASEAYKDLTNDQKALVDPEMKTKLDNVKAALADLEAAKTVTDLINNLPNPITLDSEDAIREAESAYNGLTEDQKKKITAETLQKLDDAKNALADLKAVKAVEDKIKDLITKYPEISKLSSENEEAVSDINDVLDAYNKLTETQIEKADQDLLFTLDAYENAVLKYTVIQGEGSSWMRGDYKGALFVLKRNVNDAKTFELFSYAMVDGKEIQENKDYTAEAGSVKITLKPSYLNTLSVGEHTLTVVFKDDRMIDIKFKVLARPTPVTPDYVPPRTGIEH